jgi:hypothetical protein
MSFSDDFEAIYDKIWMSCISKFVIVIAADQSIVPCCTGDPIDPAITSSSEQQEWMLDMCYVGPLLD